MIFLTVLTVLSVGLMIGTEFSVSAFINPILWQLDEQSRLQAVRLFAAKLGRVMPFWYAANFLFLVIDTILLRNQPAVLLLASAAGIWAALIILSVTFLVPINNRLAREDAALSIDQAHHRHLKWDAVHRVRVAGLAAAFVLLLAGLHC